MRLKKRFVALAALIGAVTAISTVAFAASPHFKHGGEPVCTVSNGSGSSSTICSASLTGLDGGDLTINVTVSGSAVYQCQNGGGNIAPGQNRVLVGPSTVPTEIDSSAIKNGNLTFTTTPNTLTAPSTVSGSAAGCPNSNWTGINPILKVTSISLTITQAGTLLFTCTASNPNGLTSPVALS